MGSDPTQDEIRDAVLEEAAKVIDQRIEDYRPLLTPASVMNYELMASQIRALKTGGMPNVA